MKALGALAIVTGGAVIGFAVYALAWHDDRGAQTERPAPGHRVLTVARLLDRSCGSLSVGIGWHLRATPNVRCPSARHVMSVYFGHRANRRISAVVLGYACTKQDLRDGEHVRCVRAAQAVSAKSFGY